MTHVASDRAYKYILPLEAKINNQINSIEKKPESNKQAKHNMNCRAGQSSYSLFGSPSIWEPLSIDPVKASSTDSAWSPFSTPSISPFSDSGSPSFQYSSTTNTAQSIANYLYNYESWSSGDNSPPNQRLVSPIATSIASGKWQDAQTPSFNQRSSIWSTNASNSGWRNASISPCRQQPISPPNNGQWPSQQRLNAQGSSWPTSSYSSVLQKANMQPTSVDDVPAAKSLPKRSEQLDMSDFIRAAEIKKAFGARPKMCTFCRTNNESAEIYTSHSLKDANDKITCPILMRYSCPECGASGEQTHTRKYCPVLQRKLRIEILNRLVANSKKASVGF